MRRSLPSASTRGLAALAVGALAVPLLGATAGAAQPNGRATLAGNQPSWATASRATGPVDPNAQLDLKVYLPLRDESGAAALVRAVSDPASAQYGHYLSAADFRARFSPTAAQARTVTDFLTGAGFTVAEVPDNRHYVEVVGSAGAAQKAFGTQLKTYSYKGRTLIAPAEAPSVPAALAGTISAVGGLDQAGVLTQPAKKGAKDGIPGDTNTPPAVPPAGRGKASTVQQTASNAPPPDAFVNATPCSTYYGQKPATGLPKAFGQFAPYAPCGYVPTQLRGAYGLTVPTSRGFDGRGVTVAITDAYAAPTILSDANTYATKHGDNPFAKGQFKQVLPSSFRYGYDDKKNGDLCGEQGWYGEETLDVEAVHAMAPGANVTYVASRSCDDGDFDAALNKIVDRQLAQIVSDSWGSLGEDEPPALLRAYQNTFYQAAIQGIGIYFSSGDSGDDSGRTDNGKAAVDFPASDPLVTAVGGTSLAVGKNNDYQFETGWGTGKSSLSKDGTSWVPAPPGKFIYGAGGGTSQLFDQPYYQQGVVPDKIANRYGGPRPGRAVPDIALDADPTTGMLVGETQTFPGGKVKYSEYRIGGTSLSSPLLGGVMAIADQIYGRAHGFANPAIYALAGSNALRDIKDRSVNKADVRVDFANGVDASDGLLTSLRSLNFTQSIGVRKGYDDVTGVGTPNGQTFLTNIGYVDGTGSPQSGSGGTTSQPGAGQKAPAPRGGASHPIDR